MAQKKKTNATVVSQEKLADGIYDLRLETELAQDAACGQFVGVYPKDKSTLLPRPISICEIDKEKNQLRLVYRVAGKGTAEFSNLKAGDRVYLLGVLGNGFPVDKAKPGTKAMLFGGGIGVPPILQLSKELSCEKQIVVGYRCLCGNRGRKRRHKRKCHGCGSCKRTGSGYYLCLRTDADAARDSAVCDRT